MTSHHDGHDPESIEPVTPFDEATDLLEDDTDELIRLERVRLPPLKTLIVLGGVLLAPLFGLVFGLEFALGVLVVAMAFTSWLAWEGSMRLVPEQARVLRRAAILNAVIALLALALLVGRVLA